MTKKQWRDKIIMNVFKKIGLIFTLILPLLGEGCSYKQSLNKKPEFIKGKIISESYDGINDDLLTAGLGAAGLANPERQPVFADTENPTTSELRALAIYSNYRSLVDTSPGSGYGVFYGPHVSISGISVQAQGKVAGKEYIAYSDDGSGEINVTMMVQIPDTFDPQNPCIIAAPSSGSRGVYGAIGTAGEWGLKKGCAVAYSDKGTGTGVHDLTRNTVNLITGEREDAIVAGKDSNFTSIKNEEKRKHFIVEFPFRLAFKHPHSGKNPEKDWGQFVLQSIEFAFYVLNLKENYGMPQDNGKVAVSLTPDNTLVIASSISNGGGASIRAAEQDTKGLIDGAAVSEPNVNSLENKGLVIKQGDNTWSFPHHSKNLLDYHTLLNVYQPCANLASPIKDSAPFNLHNILGEMGEELGKNRCSSLAQKGLLISTTLENQAQEAQKKINDSGIMVEQNILQPSHHTFQISEAIAVNYSNAYGRFNVTDNLCGFSFASYNTKTQKPSALSKEHAVKLFSISGGVPPIKDMVQIVNNNSKGGARVSRFSLSSEGIMDQNLDGALCLRRLVTGKDESGTPLTEKENAAYKRIKKGIAEIGISGNLNGIPVVIVNGRSDAILAPNFTSRAYLGLNKMIEGNKSKLCYYEVTNAHHLDILNGLPGFSSRYVPLNYYYHQALDLLFNHLKNGTPLPPSQVIRTVPRKMDENGSVAELKQINVPPIEKEPNLQERILFINDTVVIPE